MKNSESAIAKNPGFCFDKIILPSLDHPFARSPSHFLDHPTTTAPTGTNIPRLIYPIPSPPNRWYPPSLLTRTPNSNARSRFAINSAAHRRLLVPVVEALALGSHPQVRRTLHLEQKTGGESKGRLVVQEF